MQTHTCSAWPHLRCELRFTVIVRRGYFMLRVCMYMSGAAMWII